jgi:hypothetical protein
MSPGRVALPASECWAAPDARGCSHLRRLLFAACAAAALSGGIAQAQNQTIPWNRSVTISRTSAGEDIRNVLRSLLQAGGFSVAFAPNVEGSVSFRLEKVPVDAAFDQIIEENGLTYT